MGAMRVVAHGGLTVYFEEGTPVPWDEVDAGIVPRLRMLTDAGFTTIASCAGHGSEPWILIEGSDVEAVHRVLKTANESGYAIDVKHSFPYPTDDYCYVSMRVRWWWEPT